MLICDDYSWFDFNKLINCKNSTINLLIDRHEKNTNTYKTILLQLEPEAIVPQEEYLIKNYNKYDYIISFNENILNICPNAIKYIFGSSWVTLEECSTIDIQNKKFEMSSIFGNKMMTIGHAFRRKIFLNREKINSIPKNFFVSYDADFFGEKVPEDMNVCSRKSKLDLFKTSQFHLVIENSKQKNYFTEKLIDTLLTFTIPIYYGCPNIAEFFDTTGWIFIENESIDEINDKIKILDENYYYNHLETILQNREKAFMLMDMYANINKALIQIPEFNE
jgi:hypothetical protein